MLINVSGFCWDVVVHYIESERVFFVDMCAHTSWDATTSGAENDASLMELIRPFLEGHLSVSS